MDKWRAIQAFLKTLEIGSFGGAAREMGSDPSTISKSITRLESSLGVQLIQRSTRNLRLTDAGELYASELKEAMTRISDCEETIIFQNTSAQGNLKISVPLSFGRNRVVPLLGEFCKQYPKIKIDLRFSDSYVDIIDQRFDVAIRSGSVADSRLVARQVSTMEFLTLASPDFATTLPDDFGPQHFPDMPWLQFRFQQSGRLMPILYKENNKHIEFNPSQHITLDDADAMADLCSLGLGLCQLPQFALKQHIDQGRLLSLLPVIQDASFKVFAIYPRREHLPKKTSLLVEALVNFMQSNDERIERTWADELTSIY